MVAVSRLESDTFDMLQVANIRDAGLNVEKHMKTRTWLTRKDLRQETSVCVSVKCKHTVSVMSFQYLYRDSVVDVCTKM